MKRNSVFEEFEKVYLRSKCAKKAFANTEAVNKLLADPAFEKCARYIANATFKKNQSTLSSHGFGQEDMVSIVRILGLQFVNNPFQGETEKDTNYVLMHFMSQKMETFMIFVNRKFRIKERRSDVYLEDAPISAFAGNSAFDDVLPEEPEEEELSKSRKKLNALVEDISNLKSALMRFKLNSGIGNYKESLSEIATSKSVDFSVRKRARTLCKKNGIDYIAWAKTQIEARKLNESEFVLE